MILNLKYLQSHFIVLILKCRKKKREWNIVLQFYYQNKLWYFSYFLSFCNMIDINNKGLI